MITRCLPTELRIDQNKKLNLYSFYNQFLRVWSNSVQDKIKQRLIYVEGIVHAARGMAIARTQIRLIVTEVGRQNIQLFSCFLSNASARLICKPKPMNKYKSDYFLVTR